MSRFLLLAAALTFASFASAQELPEGKGKAVLIKICSECHAPDAVVVLNQSRKAWSDLVGQMQNNGAQGTDKEIETIVDYLATNFPPAVNVNKATSKELAESLSLTAAEADAVVKWRSDHGDFKDFDALTKVVGVDRAKLESTKGRIRFN